MVMKKMLVVGTRVCIRPEEDSVVVINRASMAEGISFVSIKHRLEYACQISLHRIPDGHKDARKAFPAI